MKYLKALERILNLEDSIKTIEKRIDEIENKQAKRFPHLIERLEQIELSIYAVVERLKILERSEDTYIETILKEKNNDK
jgi:hypothetical protein